MKMNHNPITKIAILGGGSWGTALAQAFAQTKNPTLIYARNSEIVQDINTHHQNSKYLPGFSLSSYLISSSQMSDLENQDILILATPAQSLRLVVKELRPFLAKKNPPLIIASKGIEKKSGLLMTEVIGEISPLSPLAVLSGPSFSHEVVALYPTALTLGCTDPALLLSLQTILSSKVFRLYTSSDIIGIQIGGALKNVLSIAAGIVIGRGLGENARAALITRGLSEMAILGKALNATPETFFGLSGLGDLLLTAMSQNSRNTSFGIALGSGKKKEDLLKESPYVIEGVYTAESLQILIQKFNLDLPICRAVFSVLNGSITIETAIETLLARPLTHEHRKYHP